MSKPLHRFIKEFHCLKVIQEFDAARLLCQLKPLQIRCNIYPYARHRQVII